MERLTPVVIALEEAKRLLLARRPEHHRLALILLDNAAELQLRRAVDGDLSHDELMERMRRQIATEPLETLPPTLREIAQRKPLTADRKLKIGRYFGDKLHYLCNDKRRIAPTVAEVLDYLHEYRNHAYHGARFRPTTVRALGLLLLELNCELLETLPKHWFSWHSSSDYSWLESYGFSGKYVDGETVAPIIAKKLKDGVTLGLEDIRSPFVADASKRFKDIDESITFVQENVPVATSVDLALKAAQYHAFLEASPPPTIQPFPDFAGSYDSRKLEQLRRQSYSIARAKTSQEAFRRFARTINALKEIERHVHGFAEAIDAEIQHQIDLARGK